MALFRGTLLNFRTDARDVAFGTDVRALGGGGNGTSFTMTWTANARTFRTIDPYTNTTGTTNTENGINLGWAMNQNEASANSVGSTITRKRIIPAGVWSFGFAWTSNAAALLANYNVIIQYQVWRVAANGGTRTSLFSSTPVTVNVTSLAAGSGTGVTSSASQPTYTLEPNESLHVSVNVDSQATAGALGRITNTVITFLANSGSVTLPSPGMRDLNIDTNASAGKGTGTRTLLSLKDTVTAAGKGLGNYDYLAEFFRAFNATGKGEGERELLTVLKLTSASGKGVGTRSNLVRKDLISAVGEGSATRAALVRKDLIVAVGEGAGSLDKIATYFRIALVTGEGVATEEETVIFVRDFLAVGEGVIKSRIALDWDDLPDVGGTVINVFPVFTSSD